MQYLTLPHFTTIDDGIRMYVGSTISINDENTVTC